MIRFSTHDGEKIQKRCLIGIYYPGQGRSGTSTEIPILASEISIKKFIDIEYERIGCMTTEEYTNLSNSKTITDFFAKSKELENLAMTHGILEVSYIFNDRNSGVEERVRTVERSDQGTRRRADTQEFTPHRRCDSDGRARAGIHFCGTVQDHPGEDFIYRKGHGVHNRRSLWLLP